MYMGRSLWIFSNVIFKMAAWWPYCFLRFLDSEGSMVSGVLSQVCFGVSISNFTCRLMVVIGRSLLIFSDITFKMAAWRPFCIFLFPHSNFHLAMNINSKLQWHNTYVYGEDLLIFSDVTFKMAAWQPYWIFWFPESNFSLALNMNSKLQWPNTCVYE